MSSELVEKIATSILYEGYLLYPYRSSAIKNRQRWNFGTLYPRSYSEKQSGTDAWSSQTECLAVADADCKIDLKVRFLQFQLREAGELITPPTQLKEGTEPQYRVVEAVEVGGKRLQTSQEAVERGVSFASIDLFELVGTTRSIPFNFPQMRQVELVSGDAGAAAVVARTQQAVEGSLQISATCIDGNLFRLRVRLLNLTTLDDRFANDQEVAALRSLVSAHTILHVCQGEFVSLLEPAEEHREAVAACRNIGVFPVLVGGEGQRDTMLSSPIILYDYPQVAPESAGDFFDGTEMDEMLTLRVMTLTDDEKQQMREGDERARQILARTELLPPEQLMKVHGAMRNLGPSASSRPEKDR
jgi:hydrogenase maturation protease